MNGQMQLIIAGSLSFLAALLHVAIIFGGPEWYRFFGAGEQMASLAETGSQYPTFVTTVIALILAVFALYAFSGAGVIIKLPLMKIALCLITFVYLVRGIAGLILPFVSNHPAIAENSLTFWLVSSLICMMFGAFHLFGTIGHWDKLSS